MEDNHEKEWLTSRESAELMGVEQSLFLYYVKTGDIAIKPGSKQRERLYSRTDTLSVRKRVLRKRRPEPEPISIDFVRLEDLPAAFKLAQQAYGPLGVDLATMATYQSWRKNNNQITLGAFSKDRSNCYASIQLVPLHESVILDILTSKRSESSIDPDEIRPYDVPGSYTLLATSAAYTQEDRHRKLLIELLIHYMDFWAEKYPEMWIDKVYAQADTERGEMLVQHFFMLPRWDLAHNAFMLDVNRPSASKIVRAFQNRLKERGAWPPVSTPRPVPALETAPLYRFVADNPAASTPAPTAPNPQPEPPRREVRKVPEVAESSHKEYLPDGWVSAVSFGKLHGIERPATVTEAIRARKIEAHENTWKEGKTTVTYALDPQQQRAFCVHFAMQGKLRACGDDTCPCYTIMK